MKTNHTLLHAVKDVLAAIEPYRFSYNHWAMDTNTEEPINPIDLKHVCHTVGCVAGWTLAICGRNLPPNRSWLPNPVPVEAGAALGFYKNADPYALDHFLFMGKAYFGFPNLDLRFATVTDAIQRIDWLLDNTEDTGPVHMERRNEN